MSLFGKKEPEPVVFPAVLSSPADGKFVSAHDLKDEAFASGKLGACFGVKPENGNVCAPISGVISEVTDTAHAVVIQAGGMEILIHTGIHTVNMKGEGFKSKVKLGQVVKRGDVLLQVDLWKVRNSGYDDTIITALSNTKDFANVEELVKEGNIKTGDDVLRVSK